MARLMYDNCVECPGFPCDEMVLYKKTIGEARKVCDVVETCWACNKEIDGESMAFCSDTCEQQYVKDMEAQGENIDFDGEEDIP